MLILLAVAHALDVDRPQLSGSSLTSSGTLTRPAPFLDEPDSYYVGALVTVAKTPLRFDTGEAVIDEVFGTEVGFGGVVAPRLRLDVAMDLFPGVRFPQHDWSAELETMALGDARLGGLWAIAAPRAAGVGFAVDAQARLATGSPLFTSGWGGQARAILGGRHRRLGWNVDLGADYVNDPPYLDRQLGSALIGGAGVHVWALETVVVGAEVDGRHPFAPVGDLAADTSEWAAYVGYTPCSGAQLSVGGGGTVLAGIGTPESRFLLTFGYFRGDCSFKRTAPASAIPPLEHPAPVPRRRPPPPAPRASLTETAIVIDQRVEFAYESAQLLPEARPILTAVAGVLRAHPEVLSLEVAGHTDERGDDAFNLTLSQARAQAVVDWLVGAGIDPGRLRARGYGETVPLASGHDEAAWSRNRRVELRILERATLPDVRAGQPL